MHKNLRMKVEESIETNTLSKNLLLICLAHLHDRIKYSKSVLTEAKSQRYIIAKTALDNGVLKDELMEKIERVSEVDYPTYKKIKRIATICESNDYSFVNDFIPDKMIHYKSEEEQQTDLLKKPTVKKDLCIEEDLQELIAFIQSYVVDYKLTNPMINALKSMQSEKYTYAVLLWTFSKCKEEIIKAKRSKSFKSSYHEFKYLLAIIQNELPNALKRYNQHKEQEKYFEEQLKKNLSTDPYVHIFVAPERKKLSPDLEALI